MKKMVMMATVPMSFATLVKGQPRYLSKDFDLSIITSEGPQNKEIEAFEGVPIYSINMTRKITPIEDLKALWKIYCYLRKIRPDIIYTFTPKAGLLGMMAAFFARVPIRVHNIVGMPLMEAKGIKKHILKWIEQFTYSLSTHLYSNSYGLKNYVEKNLTKKEIKVVKEGSINGVDSENFQNTFLDDEKYLLHQRLNIANSDFVLIFVGRVVKDKGVNELVQAFATLQIQYPQLKLLILGDFEEELSPVEPKTIDILKNNRGIRLLGFQKDIRPYLSIANLFVLPSYREGLPNSLIEAGSYGIPLLATNINGCNEVIIPNETGLLVEKKSIKALIAGISMLLEDKQLYEKIKRQVRKITISRYDQKDFWEALDQELLAL